MKVRPPHNVIMSPWYGLTDAGLMRVRTLRRIAPGEEILISYLGDSGHVSEASYIASSGPD